MSNEKNTGNKRKRAGAPPKPKRKKLPDDRTPVVKKVDRICKVVAVVLALLFFANVHVLINHGGYDDKEIVPVLGFASSKIENDAMDPKIKEKSAIFTRVKPTYKEGDIVQYFDGEYNTARRVIEISDNGETFTLLGDNEDSSEAVTIKADDIKGKVFLSSKLLYGFIKFYVSTLGAAITVLLSFILLLVPDILMYRKRKADLQAKREAAAKKEARKLKVKQGLEEPAQIEEEPEINPIEKRRAEKQAKLEKERAEIAAEMKQLQKKMKAEEEELKSGKRGKKK